MNLLVTFLIIVTLGQIGVAFVSVAVDRMTSPFTSVVVFFVLFFAIIWIAWRFSVWFTEPKRATDGGASA